MRLDTFMHARSFVLLAILLLAKPVLAQEAAEQESLCPETVGMYTEYQGEQFTGIGQKDEDLAFWARYNFVAHNQGGAGPIEMAGFFYLSKPECWLKGDKGVFIIYSPVIEYYGPRRDQPLACAETGGPVPDDPDLGDPYNSSSFSDTQTTGTQCSSDGGSGPSDGQTSNCYKAWVTVEVTHDGGATWQVEWEGWVSFCL